MKPLWITPLSCSLHSTFHSRGVDGVEEGVKIYSIQSWTTLGLAGAYLTVTIGPAPTLTVLMTKIHSVPSSSL